MSVNSRVWLNMITLNDWIWSHWMTEYDHIEWLNMITLNDWIWSHWMIEYDHIEWLCRCNIMWSYSVSSYVDSYTIPDICRTDYQSSDLDNKLLNKNSNGLEVLESSFEMLGFMDTFKRKNGYWVPLKADSSRGAGLGASKIRRAYLASGPLFSLGTMSWRMKRVRSLMS